jgi:hypothetical protein
MRNRNGCFDTKCKILEIADGHDTNGIHQEFSSTELVFSNANTENTRASQIGPALCHVCNMYYIKLKLHA